MWRSRLRHGLGSDTVQERLTNRACRPHAPWNDQTSQPRTRRPERRVGRTAPPLCSPCPGFAFGSRITRGTPIHAAAKQHHRTGIAADADDEIRPPLLAESVQTLPQADRHGAQARHSRRVASAHHRLRADQSQVESLVCRARSTPAHASSRRRGPWSWDRAAETLAPARWPDRDGHRFLLLQ